MLRFKPLAVALVALLGLSLPAAAGAKPAKVKTTYLVSLGDSLAQGVQPNSAGKSVETKQGYADQLYNSIKRKPKYKGLKLVKLGCPGESTKSITAGGICHYAKGNQLAQADAFMKKNKGKIAYVTYDLGANDVDFCVPGGVLDLACLNNGLAAVKANTPVIAKRIRKAAGSRAKIAGMNYYDPFLALWLKGDSNNQSLASQSQGLAKGLNDDDLLPGFKAGKFKVAKVDTAFQTYAPFSQTTTLASQTVPVAVAQICNLTWECTPAPVGPNIHANKAGYKLIAAQFRKALGL